MIIMLAYPHSDSVIIENAWENLSVTHGIPKDTVLTDSNYFYGEICMKCGILYEEV